MITREQLMTIWPLYGLVLKTPRLELKIPTELEIFSLAKVIANGIQKPGDPHFQEDWLYEPSPIRERKLLQFIYRTIADWKTDNWKLALAVFFNDTPIGIQYFFSKDFNKTRGFASGVWLGLGYQGKGFGTEAHLAILHLGFEGLGGREAYCGAWADNIPSLHLLEKLGYLQNGEYHQLRGNTTLQHKRLRLPREIWEKTKHENFSFEGLAPCFELFGV